MKWEEAGELTWEEAGAFTWRDLFGYEIAIEIAGKAIGSPRRDSLSILSRLEECSIADFQIVDRGQGHTFRYGQEVVIRGSDSEIVFGGLITEARRFQLAPEWTSCIHQIACTDYHALADRRVFLAAYEEATCADIAYDILDVLSEEGVTEGIILSDEVVKNISFNRATCSEALDIVAELAGVTWLIDSHKRLHFIERGTFEAAWGIDSTGAHTRRDTLEIISGNPEYRNVQYVRGSHALTSPQTEKFTGDGSKRAFTLRYPPAKQPNIRLNGQPQTCSIKAYEEGYEWYWSKGDPVIAQDISGEPLTADDELTISYVGSFKLVVKATTMAEVTRQAMCQGFGSGKIEQVTEELAVEGQDSAMALARAKLLHYARIGTKARYETFDPGLVAGAMQPIDYPQAGLNQIEALITGIEVTSEKGKILYKVEACDGPVEDSWRKIFCLLADEVRRRASDSKGEVDIIQGLDEFCKIWTATDHPNPFLAVYPGSATPAAMDFPCLADEDKLSYCVLYTKSGETFRKPITSQTIGVDRIETICLILATEANNRDLTHVGLWGGALCRQERGTGIEMEKHAYIKRKSPLESLQLNFTDMWEE